MSPFGEILVASTTLGICFLSFIENTEESLLELKSNFPQAKMNQQFDSIQQNAIAIFKDDWCDIPQIKLHLKGTPFQIKVWQSLLKIPRGGVSTYGRIAEQIENSKASRAVGSAIGSNPIAFLIPCHRVIQSSGLISGYRWGIQRKKAIIGWEQVKK
jgi:AraC family transcriptional regulator of adaptative response/methylated-DNA-[protein]-cysteine methyltransferase